MKVIARSNTLLIKKDSDETKTAGGIIIPSTSVNTKAPKWGEVVDECAIEKDPLDEHEVNVGDRVLFSSNGCIEIEPEERIFLVPRGSLLIKQ